MSGHGFQVMCCKNPQSPILCQCTVILRILIFFLQNLLINTDEVNDVVKLIRFVFAGIRDDSRPSLWSGHTNDNIAPQYVYGYFAQQRLQIVQHFQINQLPHYFGLSHHLQKLNMMLRFIEITKQYLFYNRDV